MCGKKTTDLLKPLALSAEKALQLYAEVIADDECIRQFDLYTRRIEWFQDEEDGYND